MSEYANITYTDSLGNEYDLMVDNFRRIYSANFHNYSWTKETSKTRFGEKIRSWGKDAQQYQVTILFDSGSPRAQMLNNFHDSLEYDIVNNTPGILTWDDYYIPCYGISSKTYPAETKTNADTANDVTFYCPSPWWYKVTLFQSYVPNENINVSVYTRNVTPFTREWLSLTPNGDPISPIQGVVFIIETQGDYYHHIVIWNGSSYEDLVPDYIWSFEPSFDFPCDIMRNYRAFTGLINDNILGGKYILTIYGPATNPSVTIDNNDTHESLTIKINTKVPKGATLVVNSVDKTVYKYYSDSRILNCFGSRDLDSGYLWDPVPYGRNTLISSGKFKYDIQLIEERSEPKWLTD